MATMKWEEHTLIFGESCYGVGVEYQHTNISEEVLNTVFF
jgi:hypothetical protein